MPGFYQHSILFRAVAMAPGGGAILPVGHMVPGQRYQDAGALLCLSTPTQLLSDYDVYHTESELAMGPFHQKWVYVGKVGIVFRSIVGGAAEVTPMAIQHLCGRGWPGFNIYAFGNYQGIVDLYVKRIGAMPAQIFAHYQVDVPAPDLWWSARQVQFIGLSHHPEWADAPMARL